MRFLVFSAALAAALAIGPASPVRAETIPGSTEAMNAFRTQMGLRKLEHDDRLQAAADAHAADMAQGQFFAHVGSDGSEPSRRIKRAGYRGCWRGENIAWGQKSLEEVMRDWIASPKHNAIMSKRKATHFGLAWVDGYWVMTMGASCGRS